MVIGFIALAMGNSDNGYLTLLAFFGFVPFVAFKTRRGIRRYILTLATYFTGIEVINWINKANPTKVLGINGLYNVIANFKFLIPLTLILWVIGIILCVMDYKKNRQDENAKAIATKIWLVIVVIVARPQMGTKLSKDKREGIEAMIAMDISNSMLAEDVAPSRLERSKRLVEDLLNRFTNDKIGLVVFAGDAFVQLPITSDYVSAKMFLDNISPSLIGTQGTDIGKAIDLSMHSFTQNSKFGKAIIIITDGENHEGGAEEMARNAGLSFLKLYASLNSVPFYRLNRYESLGTAVLQLNKTVRVECELMRKYL